MRPALFAVILCVLFPALACAQDTHSPQEWQKLYADASNQLRAAQDRKAQLSAENATLAAQVRQLQSKLQQASVQIKTLRLQVDSFDQRTYFLTTDYLYWQGFLAKNPVTRVRWRLFLNAASPVRFPQWDWMTDLQNPWSLISD
ncbi:MAG TPA: hypothetical protein VMD30_02830 [Tepidisphaeraceae bacterium]|nr:hypothetical protein [Tepidisphaeraceae bacterium]